MSSLDPNLVTLAIFAAGYLMSRWDKRGDQASNSSVAIAELRTELSSLRREVERLIDRFEPRGGYQQQHFGRRRVVGA